MQSLYFKLFHLVASKRIVNGDINLNAIHNHLLVVLGTGILMWGYAIVAYIYIDHPLPANVGITASMVHNLSPISYRFWKSPFVASFILLAAGVSHQGCYAFYTGGFESNILIWYGIIPMLAGLIAGRKAVIVWGGIVISISIMFMALFFNGYQFPNLISDQGAWVTQGMMVFGWIFLSLILIYSYIYMRDRAEERKKQKTQKVDNLVRLLCHDLSSPLSVLTTSIEIIDRLPPDKQTIVKQKMMTSSRGMIEMIKSVKELYMVDKVKADFFKQSVSIGQAIHYVELILEDRLKAKDIKLVKQIELDARVRAEESSFKNQVLMNIISNSVKFSPVGSEIIFRVYQGDDGKIKISIKDRGIGIPDDIKSVIYDPFSKTSREGTEGETGMGFGLSIMKNFVDSYGGLVQIVSSTEGKTGTEFIISLDHF